MKWEPLLHIFIHIWDIFLEPSCFTGWSERLNIVEAWNQIKDVWSKPKSKACEIWGQRVTFNYLIAPLCNKEDPKVNVDAMAFFFPCNWLSNEDVDCKKKQAFRDKTSPPSAASRPCEVPTSLARNHYPWKVNMVESSVGLISNPQNITKMTRKPWCAKALPQWVWWCTVIVNHLDVSLCMSHHTGTRKAKVTKEPSVEAAAWPGGRKQAPKQRLLCVAAYHVPWVCVVITSYKIQ